MLLQPENKCKGASIEACIVSGSKEGCLLGAQHLSCILAEVPQMLHVSLPSLCQRIARIDNVPLRESAKTAAAERLPCKFAQGTLGVTHLVTAQEGVTLAGSYSAFLPIFTFVSCHNVVHHI